MSDIDIHEALKAFNENFMKLSSEREGPMKNLSNGLYHLTKAMRDIQRDLAAVKRMLEQRQ